MHPLPRVMSIVVHWVSLAGSWRLNGQKTLQNKDDRIKILENQLEELQQVPSLKAQISNDTKASQTESLELTKMEDEGKLIKDGVSKTQRIPSFKNKNKKKRKKKQKHVF